MQQATAWKQARNQLGTPGGAKSFREGPKVLELCPMFSNYVQNIFPRGAKIFLSVPLVPGLHGSENNEKLKLETVVRSVGANLQTTIHIVNCIREG